MLFRKRSIVIEAEQWLGPPEGHVQDDFDYILPMGVIWKGKDKKYIIQTLEGEFEISPGDWIITGVKGEKYPCKPDVFELTYEKVE